MDQLIVVVAQYFFLISVIITALAWLRLPASGKWELAVTGVLGGLVGLGLITMAGSLYHDRRPFVTEHVRPLFAHAADNGFPSDHATLTMFLAVCVLFYSRWLGAVLAANAVLVGAARVLARVHSPLDIIAGFVLAVVAAVLAHWVAPWIVRRLPWAPREEVPSPAQAPAQQEPDRGTRSQPSRPGQLP